MTGNWKSVLQFEKNKNGKDFVCGDIHGCFDDLDAELETIKFNKAIDRLFCVGDLIDRGPKSAFAVDYLESNWFYSVMGNHDNMFLMANLESPDRKDYYFEHIRNGGKWAYEKPYANHLVFHDLLLNKISRLPLIIRVDNTIITHAALPEVQNLEEIADNPAAYIDMILWYRGKYPSVKIPGINRVYVGHSIVDKPKQSGKYINIDTGAFLKYWGREGKLTVLELE